MSLPSLVRRATRARARLRGFTLIELMVVVVIIGVLSTIAVPSVVERLRERRSQEAAERIAAIYRGARMRAMGRGGAVFVRYADNKFTVSEVVQARDASADDCLLPATSCLNPPQTQELSVFNVASGVYEGVEVAEGGGATSRDVCYTPLGRAYSRVDANPLTSVGEVLTFDVNRGSGAGLTRTVTVLPNGVARVIAKPKVNE